MSAIQISKLRYSAAVTQGRWTWAKLLTNQRPNITTATEQDTDMQTQSILDRKTSSYCKPADHKDH